MNFFFQLFDTSDFPARWHCGNWSRAHGWLHIASDLAVWSAYVAIPCVLGYFAVRRRNIPFRSIFLLFGAFILACGTTHLMEAVIFWWPAYRLAGTIKLITGIVSWSTVIALIPVTPKALAMRSPVELEHEIEARQEAEAALELVNAHLKEQVQRLKTSEERFRLLVEGTKDHALVMLDPVGRVVSWNAGAERIQRFRSDEILGEHFSCFYEVDARQSGIPEQALNQAEAAGRSEMDGWLLRQDGARFWANVVITALHNDEGLLRGFSTIIRDISERKAVEESARRLFEETAARKAAEEYIQTIEHQRQQLRESDTRKTHFLATLAHELRSPLAPLSNGLHILRLSNDLAVREEARQMMERQLGQLVRLVDDLLDISRISNDKLLLKRAWVPLSTVVNNAVETVRPLIEAKGHALTVTLPPDSIYLDVDMTRLSQVLSNLLSNAAKYTDPAGTIELSATRHGNELELVVRDSGIGISADDLPGVFNMFSQLPRSIDRSEGGLGIGLSLVNRLVELHGGTVFAQSDGPGQGSRFGVRLPVTTSQAERSGSGQAQSVRRNSELRVLVVDDNRDAAASLSATLQLMGYMARSAYSGQEGIELAEAYQPHWVLMDLGMPGMSGFDAIRHFRARPWGCNMKIAALTGWGQEDDKRRVFDAGFDAHLVKPVNIDQLTLLFEERGTPTSAGKGEPGQCVG